MLIKLKQNKIELGARKTSLLCLCSMMALGVFVVSPVQAQSNNPIYVQPSRADTAAQNEIRLQEMENQVRALTGKVENQLYEINSLKNKVKRLEGDVMAAQGNAPAQATPPKARITQAPTVAPAAGSANPLGIDLAATDPKPMKTINVMNSSGDATAQYEAAYASLKNKKYEAAESGFKNFLAQHTDSVLAANAKYWLGETHYVRGNFKTAAREFAEGFQKFPESAKAPDILLKLGMSLSGMGKKDQACVALAQVPIKFPVGRDDVISRAEKQRTKLSCG